jgi:hypothetical protein
LIIVKVREMSVYIWMYLCTVFETIKPYLN